MKVQVLCPNPDCAASYGVDSTLLGRTGRCKRCGRSFRLSGSAPDLGAEAPPDAALSLVPATGAEPDVLGRYRIVRRLGQGAMGAVYLALDTRLDRHVALKLPHFAPGGEGGAEALERFRREALAAARLSHPDIVPVYDAGFDAGRAFIASALVEGATLAAVIAAGPLGPRRAARLAAELADALQAAHDRGIVHRDVKPSNVLLDAAGRPLLTDFGLARWAEGDSRLTHSQAILGTPVYMAPEQARGESALAGPASDQYALGATLYEMLCGRPPFDGPPHLVIFNIVHSPVPPPRSVRAEIPADLEAICLRALAKEPAGRFADCRALAEELRAWLGGQFISGPSSAPAAAAVPPAPAPEPAPPPSALSWPSPDPRPADLAPRPASRPRPGRLVPAGIGAAALALCLAVASYWTRTPAGPRPPIGQEGPVQAKPAVTQPTPVSVVQAEPTQARPAVTQPTPGTGADRNTADTKGIAAKGQSSPAPPGPVVFRASAIDPNRRIDPSELVGIGWQVPYKAAAPALDGVVSPGEYGQALLVDFADKVAPGRVYWGAVVSPDDLGAWLMTAYTKADLYVAVLVRDDDYVYLPDGEQVDDSDSVRLFVDGDGKPNDFDAKASPAKANREGFHLDANQEHRWCLGIGSDEWDVKVAPCAGGYVAEFRIPLGLIDTLDGPGDEPAGPGSTLRFELSIRDIDRGDPGCMSTLWSRTSAFSSGERECPSSSTSAPSASRRRTGPMRRCSTARSSRASTARHSPSPTILRPTPAA